MKRRILLFMLISFGSFAQEKGFVPKKEDKVKQKGKLLALVVGNKDYRNKEDRLQNPINDSEDMAKALESLGFKVIIKANLNRVEFEKAIDDFGHQLENYETGLFYYSGHGLQAQGDNYLIPVDANIKYESEVKSQAISLNRLYNTIEGARNKTNIILLDACRNNFSAPKGWQGNNTGGFANTDAPFGSIVAFATRTGKTADDNTNGKNGLFTGELLRFLTNPDLTLRQILDKTTQAVRNISNRTQEPVRFDGLGEDIYLTGNSDSTNNEPEDKPKPINTKIEIRTNAQIKKEIAEGRMAFYEKNYEKAFRLLSPLQDSEYFSPQDQYQLGKMYFYGDGVKTDTDYALKLLRLSADKNNTYAQNALGVMYQNGQGAEKNEGLAILWYRKAAEQGLAEAQNNLGLMYESVKGVGKYDKQALMWFRKAAEQGHAAAQNNLAAMYSVEKENRLALIWFQKAAEQRHAGAQFSLGNRYANGQGVEKDERLALMWFRNAAEQGHAEAQFSLGNRYANGQGTEKDEREAVMWYQKAAEQGHARAQFSLGNGYAKGRGVEKDEKLAVIWFSKAAEQGLAEAQDNLGRIYANGLGVEKDEKQGLMWFQKAAEQGLASGQNNLGFMYEYGIGVEKDEKLAVMWFRKAVEQGNAEGQNSLGFMYLYGKGVEKDNKLALMWFQKAAEQGNADGQFSMGFMYEYGHGVEKDLDKAIEFYQKSARQLCGNAERSLTRLNKTW